MVAESRLNEANVSRETPRTVTPNIGLFIALKPAQKTQAMLLHASCAARNGHGVLILGAPGAGKSDLTLRLIYMGFILVADDQVDLHGRAASPAPLLAGLLEVRGIGIVRMPYAPAVVALAVRLGTGERLPDPDRHACGVPLVMVDPTAASAPERVALALDCALGLRVQVAGAFAA